MSSSSRQLTFGFRGDTALVTGAASGIGRATMQMLASAVPLRVIAVDQDPALSRVVSDLVADGHDVTPLCVDVADEASVLAAVNDVAPVGLAYVANCAGIHSEFSFDEIPIAEWRRVLDVNLLGAFNISRAAVRFMRETGCGAIVNVTSIEAERVVAILNPDATPHYAASKAALGMLTCSMAHALAADAIRVNGVAPGFVATPMTAATHAPSGLADAASARLLIKRYAEPVEVASAIAYLLSDGASFITGTTLHVDGGFLAT